MLRYQKKPITLDDKFSPADISQLWRTHLKEMSRCTYHEIEPVSLVFSMSKEPAVMYLAMHTSFKKVLQNIAYRQYLMRWVHLKRNEYLKLKGRSLILGSVLFSRLTCKNTLHRMYTNWPTFYTLSVGVLSNVAFTNILLTNKTRLRVRKHTGSGQFMRSAKNTSPPEFSLLFLVNESTHVAHCKTYNKPTRQRRAI